MSDERTITVSGPQAEALADRTRYATYEGAIRSGKSYMGALKTVIMVVKHPGIHCLAARWSESDTFAQLVPLWRDMAQANGLTLQWHADEQYDEVVGTGSRVYLRGLKSSEATSRYAKIRGLTLAHIWVDQAEEIPYDVFQELQGRLSQPGYPQQLMLTPNPPSEGHWIAREFPEDNSRPHFKYIRFTLNDNARILGQETADAIRAAYPVGTSPYRRLIEGRRGLAASGDAVYRGYFTRDVHVKAYVEMDPDVPLLEGWDFGHAHPCVIWEQRCPWGETRVLGGVMGQDLFLADFVPIALRYRGLWCPRPLEIRSTCDPAGNSVSNQGIAQKALDILAEFGVHTQPCEAGNHPDRRNFAIQRTADSMRRRTGVGEAFSVNPRFVVVGGNGRIIETEVLADGFEAGYVWDERAFSNQLNPNTRRPKKDGWYDHSQNCHEYIELAFGQAVTTRTLTKNLDRQALKRAQRDHDTDEAWRIATLSRGGY